MKTEIHPKYYENAKVTCACGNTFVVGSTLPEIQVEICSNCHPFYTGKQKLIDSSGRVEKYKERLEKKITAAARRKGKKVKKEKADLRKKTLKKIAEK
ncbi:MAG TPA: 50S ribosomal protein L31 [Patescibacteria group bacterium]|nr:50S ribosomal protein L31 [Patescibacteria group bacterium]